ncbi:CTF1 [Candida pseudojiufengensis]|uniref:CTF1 n=1 Tax=Candida pseudojiufengensis TaxID=497109 RepID=UPI00222435EF|nr:CTF1 [Candida pseudojiufengensis]KAI5963323.1 CTF1 [Candida pseudojiufengensis]
MVNNKSSSSIKKEEKESYNINDVDSNKEQTNDSTNLNNNNINNSEEKVTTNNNTTNKNINTINNSSTPEVTNTSTTTTGTTPTASTSTGKTSKSTTKTDKPKAFTIKYKRPRGSRACTVCRSRKVRCDAEIHIPCTNCITFGCDCVLPEVKKRGNQSGESKAKKQKLAQQQQQEQLEQQQTKKDESSNNITTDGKSLTPDNVNNELNTSSKNSKEDSSSTNKSKTQISLSLYTSHTKNHGNTSEPILNISQVSVPPSLTSSYKNRPSMHKKELLTSKIKPSLTFLGSSSIAVLPQKVGENHVQLTEDVFEVNDNGLDSVELEILKLRGAFLLPNKELASDLIDAYFEHVHPLMPVLNRTLFMKKFNDPNDSPSLMVLHAVLLCGCRVSKNPLLLDSNGSNNLASLTFFRRAKALYETNYESDPVSIIQTLILIGSYWDGPEDVTKNSYYWSRAAVGLAQGFGFQRDVTKSKSLTLSEKRVWRRIWWCLFEKDRNVAIAFGRPVVIDLNDCDVPMLTTDDFDENDSELGIVSPYPINETHALYFIHLIKLAEITGIIIKHQYSVKSESMKRRNAFSIIEHCDMLMGIWFTNLPPQLSFSLADSSSQNFYACLLNAQYYNRLFLIHRSNLIRMARSSSTNPNNYKYPSWGISFQSARMISIISKILLDRDLLKFVPTMYVYIAFSALIMLIYHVDSTNTVIASTASDSIFISRAVLIKLSEYWPIAGLLIKLFDKYANDKFKRANVIENGSRIAEEKENLANEKLGLTTNPIQMINQQQQNHQQNHQTSSSYHPSQQQQSHLQSHPQQHPQQFSLQNHHPHQQALHHQQQPVAPQPQPVTSQMRSSFSPGSTTSGVSPGGNAYYDYQTSQQQARQPISLNNRQQTPIPQNDIKSRTPQIEQLIQQYKVPMKLAANAGAGGGEGSNNSDKQTTDTSPTSSTKSFPDISLVTENIPNKQNFFENFEPTQLFPNFGVSLPPTRIQSPSIEEMGSNIYNMGSGSGTNDNNNNMTSINNNYDQQQRQSSQPPSQHIKVEDNSSGFNNSNDQEPSSSTSSNSNNDIKAANNNNNNNPSTPGFQTNFIDSSFINMNLQSGMEMNDEFNSLFNFMN